jgi:HSP20 family protein
MPVDFHADDEQYVLTAVVPGLKAEDLQIEIEDNVLTLRAEAKAQDEKSGNYLLREILPGEYLRRFRLPETADAEKAEAKVENGILTLRIPKVEAARPKKIEVQAV